MNYYLKSGLLAALNFALAGVSHGLGLNGNAALFVVAGLWACLGFAKRADA